MSLTASGLVNATNGMTVANGLTVDTISILPGSTNSAAIVSGTNTFTLPSSTGTLALLSDVTTTLATQISNLLPQYNQLLPTASLSVQVTSSGYYFVNASDSNATVALNNIPIGGVIQFMEISTTGYNLSYNSTQTFTVPASSSVICVSIVDTSQTDATKFTLFCNGIQII